MAEPTDLYGGDSVGTSGSAGRMFEPTSAAPEDEYEAGVLQWISEHIKEGEAIIKDEPAYDEIDKSISYIMGDQGERRPAELSNCPDNRLKNILNQTVAALTDIHPLFGFKTYNGSFKDQENILIKLSQAWWINNFCDLKLADVVLDARSRGFDFARALQELRQGA